MLSGCLCSVSLWCCEYLSAWLWMSKWIEYSVLYDGNLYQVFHLLGLGNNHHNGQRHSVHRDYNCIIDHSFESNRNFSSRSPIWRNSTGFHDVDDGFCFFKFSSHFIASLNPIWHQNHHKSSVYIWFHSSHLSYGYKLCRNTGGQCHYKISCSKWTALSVSTESVLCFAALWCKLFASIYKGSLQLSSNRLDRIFHQHHRGSHNSFSPREFYLDEFIIEFYHSKFNASINQPDFD